MSKNLTIKRTAVLSLGGIAGAAVLFVSQLNAADPNPAPSPQESQAVKGPPPPSDLRKFCGDGQRERAGDEFHGWGRHRARHQDYFEGRMLERLLNLTEEQKTKVKEIMAASRPKIRAIREEQMAKIQAVMDEARKEIRPILTPDQQKVFDDSQQLREYARKLKEDAKKLRGDKGGDQSQ